MFLLEWREFPSAPCLAEKKRLMTAHVSMLLKSRASLTCFRACFLPGQTKDLSAPQYLCWKRNLRQRRTVFREGEGVGLGWGAKRRYIYLSNEATISKSLRLFPSLQRTDLLLNIHASRSLWPRGLRRRSAAARLLGLRVRKQPGLLWMLC